MKLIIATKNSAKIEGAKKAFSHYFKDFTIEGISVSSDVSEQPVNNEIYLGAKNRVRNLKKYCKENGIEADWFLSIESGINNFFGEWLITNITVIEDNANYESCGSSASFPVPNEFANKVIGTSLNQVMNEIFGKDEERHNNGGGIQMLSQGKVTRIDLTEQAFMMALTKSSWIKNR
ncbi:MAG: inosine/xanthosine triphosphatase [Christensenellales bacterium]